MALVFGAGYANIAIRNLLKRAETGEYQIFCWHDADPDGYNIGRTLREETTRMPGFYCEIIDLGLTIEMGLDLANRSGVTADLGPFEKGTTVSRKLIPQLSPVAYDYFVNRRQRIEINSIDPPSFRMQLIEDLLRENGVRPKVVPPAEDLRREARSESRWLLQSRVEAVVENLLDVDGMGEIVIEEFRDEFTLGDDPAIGVQEHLDENPSEPWESAISLQARRVLAEKRSEIDARI